jgi:phage antirepressor YoqD-like protein
MAETAKRQREEEAARRKAEQAKPKVEKTDNMYNFSG